MACTARRLHRTDRCHRVLPRFGVRRATRRRPRVSRVQRQLRAVPKDAEALLARACPIVGSYGAADRGLREDAARLSRVLRANGVAHDIKVYPDAGHSFLNDHDPTDVPVWAVVAGALSRSDYHEPSADDARQRITAFFDAHLTAPADEPAPDDG